jgi:hypothetical protein
MRQRKSEKKVFSSILSTSTSSHQAFGPVTENAGDYPP